MPAQQGGQADPVRGDLCLQTQVSGHPACSSQEGKFQSLPQLGKLCLFPQVQLEDFSEFSLSHQG